MTSNNKTLAFGEQEQRIFLISLLTMLALTHSSAASNPV